MASNSQAQSARYYGEVSPKELKNLERNAARAKPDQMAKAAAYLQGAFEGQYYAWFGGWALKLRGSRRDTKDLDLLVLAADIRQVSMSFWELNGSIQERMFVDIGESDQVVGVDIVLAGKLNTPALDLADSYELIQPAFRTPQGDQVSVIALTWQVEGKLAAWISRRKNADFEDLEFLFRAYRDAIRDWSEHLDLESRRLFYDTYKIVTTDKKRRKEMKQTLSLDS